MPPMECPTRTTGVSGATASSTAARSRPSWSMVQWSDGQRYPGTVIMQQSGQVQVAFPDGRRPGRAPVRPLVVEDEAVTAAQRLALEVPAVEVEGVPVDEDQGRTVPSSVAAGAARCCFVDLDGQPYAVIRDNVAALAAQRPQLGTQPGTAP